jgi:putative heme-binding domain-containing protein
VRRFWMLSLFVIITAGLGLSAQNPPSQPKKIEETKLIKKDENKSDAKTDGKKDENKKTETKKNKKTDQKKAEPKGKPPEATKPETLKTLPGFKVELIHSVPKDAEGSWVSMCTDPKGRLIVCDQNGGLFRVTPPEIGKADAVTKVEKIPANIGEAQGLLYAFDSLYVVVNGAGKFQSGLYRVKDTNGDDLPDQVEQLRKLDGGGEHGPHAVMLTPDGKNLTIVCGNSTKLTQFTHSRTPTTWGEDHLLPRMPDGNGFMAGVNGPGGAIYKVDPDGKNWEIQCVGFRNQYDAAYNRDGELFTYDADMEWDINTPWYRPTRVCQVVSGGEYGWRNGAGKWPAYYFDSLPAVVNIGFGSPTGVTFGYGAKFPAKYQDAFFICDWSYGKLYAAHLTPDGSTYTATFEDFVSGTPLPLTDLVVNPKDGALYFAIGGRRTQSGLYRVTYTGKESTAPSTTKSGNTELRKLRHELEALHDPKVERKDAIPFIWGNLDHPDRFIRFAARVALEYQPVTTWIRQAMSENKPGVAIPALLALLHVGAKDPFHHPNAAPVEPSFKNAVLTTLAKFDFTKLNDEGKLNLLRLYHIAYNRMGAPDEETKALAVEQLNKSFPTESRFVNSELLQVLVYLDVPYTAERGVKLLEAAKTQEEQIDIARSMRMLKSGWSSDLRERYFKWFVRAADYKGGSSFKGFMNRIKGDALALVPDVEKVALKPILDAAPEVKNALIVKPRPIVKNWKIDDLAPKLESGLRAGRDFEKGRQLFALTSCYACHRYGDDGGAHAPDLTGVAGRFNAKDLLESIIDPNKTISDQYAASNFFMEDGRKVSGRVANLNGDTIMVMTNMLEPGNLMGLNRRQVESQELSRVSMMPSNLIDSLTEDEILDLMAYLLSRNDKSLPMFKK